RGYTGVSVGKHGTVEVRAVRDVADVQEQLERLLPPNLMVPASPDIGLEVIGPSRTVALAVELDVLHRIQCGAAVGASGDRVLELAIAIDVDGAEIGRAHV